MTLLQLLGGQIWPNFLPILALKPRKVIFLTSKDSVGDYSKAIKSLKAACDDVNIVIETSIISTQSTNPTLEDCIKSLSEINWKEIDLVNLTGGTKIMAIAAYQLATKHKTPSFYLDTRRQKQAFEDFNTGTTSLTYPSLEEISQKLNARLALKAQGFPVPSSFKTPAENHIAFAREAGRIRKNPEANKAISEALSQLRKSLSNPAGARFLEKGKLRDALQKPIVPIPNSPWHIYLKAAATHGIIQELDPPGEFLLTLLDPTNTNSNELSSDFQTHFKLMEGIWFELLVLDHLKSQPQYSDVCWSVEGDYEQDSSASSLGETDLVAFNHQSLNLHFISCKTTGPKETPLEHIQGLRARATKEGGSFSKAELWIFSPKSENHRKDLKEHCLAQKVDFHIFSELL